MTKQAAYTQTEEQVLSSVQSTKEGLTSAQAKERLEKYGPNALQAGEKTTVLQKFINQFKDFMIIVLLAAAVISFFAHEGAPDPTDAIVILAVVILNAIVGVIQESKAEEAIEALQKNGFSSCNSFT